ncbi:MAG: DUF4856 domain-containing protein [Bacteroidota bacterium]
MPPGLSGDMLQVEGPRGTTVSIPLALDAEAGVKSLTLAVDGGGPTSLSVTTGTMQANYTHSFDIPGATTLGTVFNLVFTLTDEEDAITRVTAMVTTTKSIDTPSTYEFSRNGETSVSYSGQIERLDQLEAIKAYIKTADGGAVVSEQVFLDMFANTGGDGAGNFTFTSTKQLKDKTFVPDLDAQLFEDMFARAAAASVDGNAGVEATNGTAGLIVRENSGNTVLVDENGREFTQFIEKGLMGAVLYNQIYNTYLTDVRIGNDVENFELSEGKNYTAMEHHWDEAFGYWDPPLDFTSPWPSERGSEDRFWSHYSNTVDNVNNGLLGTNSLIMTALKEGRTAIVNNDLAAKDTQRDVLYGAFELVAAGTAVHYINDTIGFLGEGKTGEAFHVLSEAWAFTNALRYSPQRTMDLGELETIMETDFGSDGNFWNATVLGLNTAKSKIVAAFPDLAPVQDDL